MCLIRPTCHETRVAYTRIFRWSTVSVILLNLLICLSLSFRLFFSLSLFLTLSAHFSFSSPRCSLRLLWRTLTSRCLSAPALVFSWNYVEFTLHPRCIITGTCAMHAREPHTRICGPRVKGLQTTVRDQRIDRSLLPGFRSTIEEFYSTSKRCATRKVGN